MRTSGLFRDLRRLYAAYRCAPIVRERDRVAAPRVAVIMGAQVLKGGRPSRTLEARVRHAARLYAGGELDLLIPTGGLGEHPPREADLMKDILLGEGVPEEFILPEGAALNTWESARRVAQITRSNGIGRVRVVTDPLHCIRTTRTFEEAGLRALAEPVYSSPMWRKPWSRRGQLAREAVALVWYAIRYSARLRPVL